MLAFYFRLLNMLFGSSIAVVWSDLRFLHFMLSMVIFCGFDSCTERFTFIFFFKKTNIYFIEWKEGTSYYLPMLLDPIELNSDHKTDVYNTTRPHCTCLRRRKDYFPYFHFNSKNYTKLAKSLRLYLSFKDNKLYDQSLPYFLASLSNFHKNF